MNTTRDALFRPRIRVFWDRGSLLLPDDRVEQNAKNQGAALPSGNRSESTVSLRSLIGVVARHAPLAASVVGGLLALCLLYCLLAPRKYDATAKVELRTTPASALHLDGAGPALSASILSAPMAIETTATIFRSDRLAWDAITNLKLYEAPAFKGNFAQQFPTFNASTPTPEARAWLIERFHQRLRVQSIPRTLLLEIRFRSKDPALAAAAVNALIAAYGQEETASRQSATSQSSAWLGTQLDQLKTRMDSNEHKLDAFREEHGFLRMPSNGTGQNVSESDHNSTLVEIDELGHQLVAATADRILAEAAYHAATQGDPELVVASSARSQNSSTGDFSVAVLQQIRGHRSDLEQERAQLSSEHGTNYPRVIEIGHQLQDLAAQQKTEDARLVESFRNAWKTASAREQSVRESLRQVTGEGMKLNRAATEYERMQQEADSSHDLYVRVQQKAEEAGLTAGSGGSAISIVDPAFPPSKPASPNPPLAMAITLFVSLWLALAAVLIAENLRPSVRRVATTILLLALAASLHAQAPTPSTSGLPTGVTRIAPPQDRRATPDPRQAPAVWDVPTSSPATQQLLAPSGGVPMPASIGANDFLDVSEYHTPEFHSAVRVSAAGIVTLPMIGEIHVGGLSEPQAARAIEAALVSKSILLHPLVSVLVTSSTGQDVSVLGEVTRPGVYPFTVHHRLLDLISAAAGLSPSAGRLVNIYHRDDPRTPHPVVLDPGGTDIGAEHNPELSPGDTLQVSHAGLVYVIGDVIRPGGFSVDPAQGLTVVQALSLAWGPSQNAATTRAILIREQKGGRTMITLNLRRMLRGQEPDQPVHDRDILFIPDSTARNLLNRTIESAIQSTVGVAIYSGLVYSQRY